MSENIQLYFSSPTPPFPKKNQTPPFRIDSILTKRPSFYQFLQANAVLEENK